MKWIKEVSELAWTLAGTGLVLITLSGSTRTLGIWISVAGLVVHFVGVLARGNDDDDV